MALINSLKITQQWVEDEANSLVRDEIKRIFNAKFKSLREKTKNLSHLMVVSWRCMQKCLDEFKLIVLAHLQLWVHIPNKSSF